MPLKSVLTIFLCTIGALAQAKPAPWYWWVSKVDAARICMQTPPGDGWTRERGPYRDAHCSIELPR
jgi:hypothetical protein